MTDVRTPAEMMYFTSCSAESNFCVPAAHANWCKKSCLAISACQNHFPLLSFRFLGSVPPLFRFCLPKNSLTLSEKMEFSIIWHVVTVSVVERYFGGIFCNEEFQTVITPLDNVKWTQQDTRRRYLLRNVISR